MSYVSTAETAEKWGVSAARVRMLASSGRIPGAKTMGRSWLIPSDSEKPADARTKAAREAGGPAQASRFPLYLFSAASADSAPECLAQNELALLRAQELVARCEFDEAERLLRPLAESPGNALFASGVLHDLCICEIALGAPSRFAMYAARLASLSSGNEIEDQMIGLVRSDLEAYYKGSGGFANLRLPAAEGQMPSGLAPFLTSSSTYSAAIAALRGERVADALPYEVGCAALREWGLPYAELQARLSLAMLCFAIGDKPGMARHARRAAAIGLETGYILSLAVLMPYAGRMLSPAIEAASAELAAQVREAGGRIHEGYVRLTRMRGEDQLFAILGMEDLAYVLMAARGMTNKEIAAAKGLSRVTVGKRFEAICGKLAVGSKRELAELARRSLRSYGVSGMG